jgi:site-specific DNA recombinase
LDGQIVVNKEQAAVIQHIFSEALSGKGTQKIADGLNAKSIPSKRGSHWTATTIRGILGNEKYTGDVILQKTYTDEYFNRHYNYGEKDQYLIQNHHEAIISHDDFEAVAEILMQHRKEKRIKKGCEKYQNRYPFSGKIKCSECGSTFKRRIHGSGDGKYIAWCCSKHIYDVSGCSMRFIREDAIHQAFITMINKLIFGHQFILKPLLQRLRAVNYSDNLVQIQELETKIEENAERSQVLMGLMTKGYLEPALFNTQNNELRKEAVILKEQKETLSHSVNGGMTKVSEVELLFKFVSRADNQINSFDEDLFDRYVEKIIVYSQAEVGFKMKCGIALKEGLVR